MKQKWRWLGTFMITVSLLLTSIGLVPTPKANAATHPSLVITEVANVVNGRLFEYVEIHNTTNSTINLDNYKLLYYTTNFNSPANQWPITNKSIGPRETMVLWLKNFDNPSSVLSDFNAYYNVNLTSSQVFEIQLTTTAQGLHDTAHRKLAIANDSGTVLSSAIFNANGTDNTNKRTNYYSLPASGSTMELYKRNQVPNPGSLPTGQLSGLSQSELDLSGRTPWSELNSFMSISTEGAVIPGLKEGLIPQAMAYSPTQDWILMTSYRENGKPSVLTVINAANGSFVKALNLYNNATSPYTGHAGGVAVSESNVWIASGQKVYRIPLTALASAHDGDNLVFAETIDIDTRGSYLGYSDGVLWVGEFSRDNYATDPTHHINNRNGQLHRSWVAGYTLNASDTITTPAVPDYILSTGDEIQGITFVDDKILLYRSYGRNNRGFIYIYDSPLDDPSHQTVTVKGVSRPLWFLDGVNLTKTQIVPSMIQNGFELDGQVYTLTESGASKYLDGRYPIDRLYLTNTNSLLQ